MTDPNAKSLNARCFWFLEIVKKMLFLDPRQCSEESPEFGSFRPSVYPDVFLERAI